MSSTGERYADAVMQLYEGRPAPNIRRLVVEAFNAGYVQALQDRQQRGSSLRERMKPEPTIRLPPPPRVAHHHECAAEESAADAIEKSIAALTGAPQ